MIYTYVSVIYGLTGINSLFFAQIVHAVHRVMCHTVHRGHKHRYARTQYPASGSIDGSREALHQDSGRKPGPDPAAGYSASLPSLGVTPAIARAHRRSHQGYTGRHGFADARPAKAGSGAQAGSALGREVPCSTSSDRQPARPERLREPGYAGRRGWNGQNVRRRRAYREKPATSGWIAEPTRRWLASSRALLPATRFWKLPRSSKSPCNSSSPSCSSQRRMLLLPLLAVSPAVPWPT